MPFFLAGFQILSSVFKTIIDSRIGQMALAFLVGWIWAYWDTSSSWKAEIEAERAAIEQQHQAEIRRQQAAAAEIAAAATARAEDDQKVVDELRKQIDDFNAREMTYESAPTPKTLPRTPNGCAIDDNFADVVRHLDKAGHRKSSTPRRTR